MWIGPGAGLISFENEIALGQLWNNSYAIHSVGGANLEVLERYVRGLDSPEC